MIDQKVAEKTPSSIKHIEEASKVLCRGMSSGARLRSNPIVVKEAEGARLTDLDGNEYVDLLSAFGPIILGHGYPAVTKAALAAVERGVFAGAPTREEAKLADALVEIVPSAERVVFATTGSEAVQNALRIARVATGRRAVVRFEGHYHGWLDPMHTNAPPTSPAGPDVAEPLPRIANTAGAAESEDVLVARWNDYDSLEAVFKARSGDIACVIMEPISCNMGTLEPDAEYLRKAQDLCKREGAVLIFDEVLSGFRASLGGAQERLGITPDMGIFSKAIANGFPISVIVGSDEVMSVAADGPLKPAGTFAGHAVSAAAALETLAHLRDPTLQVYEHMEQMGARLQAGLEQAASESDLPITVRRVGSVFQLLWDPHLPLRNYADTVASDQSAIAWISERTAAYGAFAAPRGLLLINNSHGESEIDRAAEAFASAMKDYAEQK